MRHKILTVDDAKTVRIIIKKAFRSFDCEIIEAVNGVEGLAIAAKHMPDLILLDITMPVMDGIEMLTRLKADPQLKSIPVMMLTAEGGRDNVLKIAKLGVRDYIIKPFKEDTLIEKIGRILDLLPLEEGTERQRSTQDPADILLVEDKPAIIQQITDGLKHTPWKVHGVQSQGAALDFCTQTVPHLIIISLSLPDESAFALFRGLRANMKTKSTPVFGLVVKTEVAVQAAAQQVGITSIVTKPIDMAELESRMSKAMNLDISSRYFQIEPEFLNIMLPANCTPISLTELEQYLQPKLAEAVNTGINKVVLNVSTIRYLDMSSLKLLVQIMQACKSLGMNYALIGNSIIAGECKNLEETKFWDFHESVENAKAHLVSGGQLVKA
ncbi:MAG TPA: response regulator [Opitutaceae bacterium]|jgi:two-component system cell cycle response regulator|nr:response regulator [Opitutaceae bacterium]